MRKAVENCNHTLPAASMPGSLSAVIFDIQRFSLHDGPGIRTTVFFKGCPLRCAWCQNPESHKVAPEIAFYHEQCVRCFHCRETCPHSAITSHEQLRVDFSACTHCGACVGVCPQKALRMLGRYWSVDAVLEDVKKDFDFFVDSGGGITLSGGEPLMQTDFIAALLPRLKAEGIHVALETCGLFKWDAAAPLFSDFDLVFFDLKIMDARKHKQYTRSGNAVILGNFAQLARIHPCLHARLPLVPGITDTEDNIVAVSDFLRSHGHSTIACLPYHRLGESKLSRIQAEITPLNLETQTGAACEKAAALFAREGIDASVYAPI